MLTRVPRSPCRPSAHVRPQPLVHCPSPCGRYRSSPIIFYVAIPRITSPASRSFPICWKATTHRYVPAEHECLMSPMCGSPMRLEITHQGRAHIMDSPLAAHVHHGRPADGWQRSGSSSKFQTHWRVPYMDNEDRVKAKFRGYGEVSLAPNGRQAVHARSGDTNPTNLLWERAFSRSDRATKIYKFVPALKNNSVEIHVSAIRAPYFALCRRCSCYPLFLVLCLRNSQPPLSRTPTPLLLTSTLTASSHSPTVSVSIPWLTYLHLQP